MSKSERALDLLSIIFSLGIIGAAALWFWRSGALSVALLETENPVWYLIRSAGGTAYILLTVSVLWGLVLSSRVVKDWSPGVLSMLLHSTISWLALLFGISHALLLMLDNYYPYQLQEILIPFRGPYRPEAVGLGTVAFWTMLVVVVSFPLKRFIGNQSWKIVHLTSYVTFILATLHGLFAGTDTVNSGFQLMIGVGVVSVLGISGYRVVKGLQTSRRAPQPARIVRSSR